jgi:hypothetical protein
LLRRSEPPITQTIDTLVLFRTSRWPVAATNHAKGIALFGNKQEPQMFKVALTLAVLFTAAFVVSSPSIARNVQVGRVPMPNCPGGCIKRNVGQGDTIDGIPWGGHPGDGSWGIVNNNLPGKGPYGN